MGNLVIFVKDTFGTIKTEFLLKSYFFAAVMLFLVFKSTSSMGYGHVFFLFYCVVAFVVYPFADVLWNDLITTLTGGTMILLPLWIMIIWKIAKIMLLFMFAPLIAPIGIIYLWIFRKTAK